MSARATDPLARRPSVLPATSGDDPIFALHAEAQRRSAAGEDVVNSTLGMLFDEEGRLATIPAVGEAYRRVPWERGAPYAPIAGPEPFLAAVTADILGTAQSAREAVAIATPGGTGALALAVSACLEPGQSVLTTSYHWSPYGTIAAHAGRGLETFAMFAPDGRFDALAFAQALEGARRRQGRALVFLNTPCHNPTGYTLDDQDWRALTSVLAAEAAGQELFVLVDFAYARYAAGDGREWLRHAEPLLGQVTWLVAWSASKAFAQYGARVGACVVLDPDLERRERLRSALAFACRGSWSNGNHLGMLALTECLQDPALAARVERERGELRALLARRAALFTRLAREAGLAHPRYEGGFFVSVFCSEAERVAAELRTRGVFVVPVAGALRVALCSTPVRALPRLVEALAAGVRPAGGRA